MKNHISSLTDPRDIISAADRKNLTLSVQTILNFIVLCVEWILKEIPVRRQNLYGLSVQEMVQATIRHTRERLTSTDFASDWHLYKDYFKVITYYVWSVINRKEAQFIIDNLHRNELFRNDFFYGTQRTKIHINMVKVLERIRSEVNYTYGLELKLEDVSTFVYEELVMNDNLEKFNTFKFKTSIFSWLGVVVRRALIEHLEDDKMINIPRKKTASNTNLTLRSKSSDYCQYIIDTLVEDESKHDLLTKVYVERLSKEEIAQEYGITLPEYEKLIKQADAYLRDLMIRSSEEFEDAISEKDAREIHITGEAAADLLKWVADKGDYSPIYELMGADFDPEHSEEMALSALAEIEASMKFSDRDKIIWQGKAKKLPSVKIGDMVHQTPAFVDMRYNRLRVKFGLKARKWALKKGIISQGEFNAIEKRLAKEAAKRRRKRSSEEN